MQTPTIEKAHDSSASIEYVADRAFNDKRYVMDTTKVHALGWQPAVTFEDGLRETFEWYRENIDYWPENIETGF